MLLGACGRKGGKKGASAGSRSGARAPDRASRGPAGASRSPRLPLRQVEVPLRIPRDPEVDRPHQRRASSSGDPDLRTSREVAPRARGGALPRPPRVRRRAQRHPHQLAAEEAQQRLGLLHRRPRQEGSRRRPRPPPTSRSTRTGTHLRVREQADHPEPGGRRGDVHAAARRHERQHHRVAARPTPSSRPRSPSPTASARRRRSASTPSTATPSSTASCPSRDAQGQVQGGLEGLRQVQGEGPFDQPPRRGGRGAARAEELPRQGQEAAQVRHPRPLHRRHRPRRPRLARRHEEGDRGRQVQGLREVRHRRRRRNRQGASRGPSARDGTELASDKNKVKEAFDKMAARSRRTRSASTCSRTAPRPARASTRSTVEAHTKNPDGSGALKYKFVADGFGPARLRPEDAALVRHEDGDARERRAQAGPQARVRAQEAVARSGAGSTPCCQRYWSQGQAGGSEPLPPAS